MEILTHVLHGEKVSNMRVFLTILILIFSLQSWTKADDIRDFEIEGMSIGDSLLDYMSIDQIKEVIKLTADNYNYLKNSRKYREAYIFNSNDFEKYEKLSMMFKQNDKNFEILSIRGLIDFNENLNGCLSKLSEIAKDIENSIPNLDKNFKKLKHPLDETGKSVFHLTTYKLVSGSTINLSCNDWNEKLRKKNNWSEGLSVGLYTNEVNSWLGDRK